VWGTTTAWVELPEAEIISQVVLDLVNDERRATHDVSNDKCQTMFLTICTGDFKLGK